MRKDVELVTQIYLPPGSAPEDDLTSLGWPAKPADLAARYQALLSNVDFDAYSSTRPLRLLDVGCGLGLLLDYLEANALLDRVAYTGVDLNDRVLAEVRRRWPDHRFDRRDVREQPYDPGAFDMAILCGIFTSRFECSYEMLRDLAQTTLMAVWPSVTGGLAFNSISKHVDWERDDLFHWPLDEIMAFCKRDLSRHVSFKLDYGLWEVSTLVRKAPAAQTDIVPSRW
ncbi:class I SAM-dependent methyltransferase [Jannaschia seohaensis]|uniref:Methyltransferase domain-containing protein n=1 Tax=Jannaschia seohaensis TaxID=475081 RepID=A0A2Y9AIR4_9RHOB|nr:class I SAM-dependent methyltransferase [Jannaschia seohaensis]PWJ20216.1 methyltransferase family protein [Jannaschia seohaensis]SSA44210.1 Methyltransferase domain-containing protein [Jannaschia seohaensis]